jgi:Helix-turn-helix domain
MADSFTKMKFDCLVQIAMDRCLPPLASSLAIILTEYINRQSRTAWPTQETLANRLGVTIRAVQKVTKALEDKGHLSVTVARGRHKPNVYRFIQKNTNTRSCFQSEKHEQSFAFSVEENMNNGSQEHEQPCTKTRTAVRTEPIDEPSDEPIEGKILKESDSIPKTRRRRVQTSWPDGFHLGDEQAKDAESKARWDLSRAFAEFERFENYHRGKGSMFADWKAAWRMWVMNGIKFDRERAQNQGAVIDNDTGKVVSFPQGSRQHARSSYRGRSNTELAFEEDGDDE